MQLNKEDNNSFQIFDLHADTLQRVLDESFDLGSNSQKGHLDIPRMQQGGLAVQFFSIWVNPKLFPKEKAIDRSWKLVDSLEKQLSQHSDKIQLVVSSDQVQPILEKGKIAVGMGIEGGHSINGNLDLLEAFFQAGVRYMTLTWSNSNEICGSSGDDGRDKGLTDFGHKVVKLMNKLGMMVDISHVSDKAFYDVLDLTTQPVIASHSNLRSICSHPRNLTNDMLKALAKQGGVCCINFYPAFLDENYYQINANLTTRLSRALAEVREIYAHNPDKLAQAERETCAREFGKLPKVSYKKVVDHIEKAVELVGIDHVGVGSDYDGISVVPVGLEDVSRVQIIAQELLQRGFDSQSVKKIFFGNVMRVFSVVSKQLGG